MKDKIIETISSYLDNYVGVREGYRAIRLSDLPEISAEIEACLIWHGPDVVPPAGGSRESIIVINQSKERVVYDYLDEDWYSANIPTREAHVEKWRYLEPIKR